MGSSGGGGAAYSSSRIPQNDNNILPDKIKSMIQNIKEIAGNHSDEEIHAMLRECSMDPNETTQKLLFQDPFHEVRRKRDKKKENLNRESSDSRWKTGTQVRGGRGGMGIFPHRSTNDAGDGRFANAGKENGVNQGSERGVLPSTLPVSQETDSKALFSRSSSLGGVINGPTTAAHGSYTRRHVSEVVVQSGLNAPKKAAAFDSLELRSALLPPPPPVVAKTPPSDVNVMRELSTHSADHLTSPVSVLGVYSSASDPVLVPSLDSWLPGTVGTIKREVGSQWTGTDSNSLIVVENKSVATQDISNCLQINKVVSREVLKPELSLCINEKASTETGSLYMHENMTKKSQILERNQNSDSAHPSSSSSHGGTSNSRPSSNDGSRSHQLTGSQRASTETGSLYMHENMTKKSQILERNQNSDSAHPSSSSSHGGTSNSRPSSNDGSRSHQLTGSQKAGPSKEWKPKPSNSNSSPVSGIVGTSEVGPITVEVTNSHPSSSASVSEEPTTKLQQKMEGLHIPQNQYVIIPNHLQVPEAQRSGLSFGSFDANFGVKRSYNNDSDTDKCSTPFSESSQEIEEVVEEPCSSNQIECSTTQGEGYSDHLQSPKNASDNLSPVEANVSSSVVHEYNYPKTDATPLGGLHYSVVHTAPNYSFGLMPPILGTQFAPFGSSESQRLDASRLSSFVVQQPFDPSASYYTQFYQPSADGDGRFSPFLAAGAANKYNGNIAVLSPQSGQPQESGNSQVLSTAGPTQLATQAAGVVQSSLAVTQQPVPVFRQPSGVHLPHYPPNYIPYSQYFSPFYLPPQTIHHYLTNPPYPQQPPTGSLYPPPAAAATGMKYSISQYKTVSNTGNSTQVGVPSVYSPYSSSPTGYSPAATTTNSSGNEDLSASQYKENNAYVTEQQCEGSAVWIPAPTREISGLQTSSFYSLSPQGQHLAFAPTQAGHDAFTGIYHPTQTMPAGTVPPSLQQSQTMAGAVEMVGSTTGVYQQPQCPQMNWTSNY